MNDIVGILLAAGSSRRFGSCKLTHLLDNGQPVGVAAAASLLAALPTVIAVVRPGDAAVAAPLAGLGLHLVENPRADRGMGSSIATGVKAAAGAGGWLIALADMPWIRPVTIRALAGRLGAGASIVAPAHAGQRGHPVGFNARWRSQLEALDGEWGARELIAAHRDALHLFDTDDQGVLRDVDRPEDLRQLP